MTSEIRASCLHRGGGAAVPQRSAMIVALLVGLACGLLSIPSARAACDPRDIASAVVVSLETTATCEPVCEDKYRCYGAAILGGALTVVANREGQDKVDLFCGQVEGTANEVVAEVREVLQYQFVQQQLGEISSYLNSYSQDAAQVVAIAKCACATEKLNVKNQSSFGSCANQMLQSVGCGSIDFTTGVIESCTPGGKLIQDFFNSTWGGVKSIGCDSNLTSWLFDCGVGGTAGPRATQCYAGYQTDLNGQCYPCSAKAHGITLANGRCGCESAYTPLYVTHSNIPVMLQCACQPPYQQVGDLCLCPSNMRIDGDACVPCKDHERYLPLREVAGVTQLPSCQSCELGYRPSPTDPTQCVQGWPCDEKAGQVPNPDTYGRTCLQCSSRQRVASDQHLYKYRCEDCAPGQRSSPDHRQCVPECPAGMITNTAKGVVALGKAPPACIACAAGERAVYDQPGSSIGQCLLKSALSVPLVRKDCAAEGANLINDPANPTRCRRCPEGQRPNEARSACIDAIVVPRRDLQRNDAVQADGRREIRLRTPAGTAASGRECPANMQPDPHGAACVPRTDSKREERREKGP